jgi:hypothetical protein
MLRNKSIFQISSLICLRSISICNLLIDLPTSFTGKNKEKNNLKDLGLFFLCLIFFYEYRTCSEFRSEFLSPTTQRIFPRNAICTRKRNMVLSVSTEQSPRETNGRAAG